MNEKFKSLNIPLIICIFSIVFLSLYISIGLYKKYVIQENTFRLHVVANSNSIEDQIIKLKIANKIESYINTILNNNNLNKKDIYNTLNKNINQILDISNNEIKSNNLNYISTAKLGKINYSERENIYTSMDKGTYDSIEILLGKAEGKNYWNLIFPNENNIKNLEGLENVLPGISSIYEDKNSSENSNNNINYSFKILEIIQKVF